MESQSWWFQHTKDLVATAKTLIELLIHSDSAFLGDRRFLRAKRKIERYEKFVNKKFDHLLAQSQDLSLFDKSSLGDLSGTVAPLTQKSLLSNLWVPGCPITGYLPTDYAKLRTALRRGSQQDKTLILNGLHWRVLNCREAEPRRMNIIGILHYDVLWVKSGEFAELLAQKSLVKPVVRILQLISLDSQGKRLLFAGNSLHKDLISLVGQCQDPECLEYVINTLGQISSLPAFKLPLIAEDIIAVCMSLLRSGRY
jgi:hypothetical protein